MSINDNLSNLSKEELISKIKSLTMQNKQLKNILEKQGKTPVVKQSIKPYNFERCTYRHILLKVLYLGWNYHGYTIQEDTNQTIEDYLFNALIKTCLIRSRNEANYHRCGRTDKGVSSFNQVISIDVRSKLAVDDQYKVEEEIDYCLVLNRVLPDNIQCIGWSPVDTNFSARFDCKERTYKYFFIKGQFDISKMQLASKYLVGTHDFRNFCKMDVGNGVIQFTRNILSIEFHLCDNKTEYIDEYTMYVATITGQAFLWHQIRCIMGVLFLIGEDKEKPEVILELLDVVKNPRKPIYNMANEVPLNLYNCMYEDNCVNWQYRDNVLNRVLDNLNKNYAINSIKCVMVKAMISDIKLKTKNRSSTSASQVLLQGVKSKRYTPLMKRQKCESLEDKIQHFIKRKKLQTINS